MTGTEYLVAHEGDGTVIAFRDEAQAAYWCATARGEQHQAAVAATVVDDVPMPGMDLAGNVALGDTADPA